MLIVCLAKSEKYGGRCVAGIQVEARNGGRYTVLRDNGEPRWIRPVANTSHGEVPEGLVHDLKLLDIVEFDSLRPVGTGFQQENYAMALGTTPRVLDKVRKDPAVLANLTTNRTGPLFSNRGKAIPAEKIDDLDHSLVMINAGRTTFHNTETKTGKRQVRATFTHSDISYDFPVTDPEFKQQLGINDNLDQTFDSCFLTLSVGMAYDEWHYKLVAGVFVV